jgi:putative hydrolase of the HAD superfamily
VPARLATVTERSPSNSALKAVLLDNGGVLVRPIGGRWKPFEQTVLLRAPHITPDQFDAAIAAGFRSMHAAADYADYLHVILRHLGVVPDAALLADLLRPLPATEWLETFPDVPGTLRELRSRGVRMAVVSDAWPDLPQSHAELGIGEFFEAYAISKVLGCCKPDPRMYHHASDALGLKPRQCLFVDDHADLVAAAINLGYAGRVICRNGNQPGNGAQNIASLSELPDLFWPREATAQSGRLKLPRPR